jgi:hypothetical protein
MVFDFAPRQAPADWPSLVYVPKEFAEALCTLNPLDSRNYLILGQELADETARFAQWVHVTEILLGSESHIWPDNPQGWFAGWHAESLHWLLHLYDSNYRQMALKWNWLGSGKADEQLLERWLSLFRSDTVLGKLYSNPHFVRALSPRYAEKGEYGGYYDQAFLFCSLDLSRLPLVDAKWMAEAVLLARIHHLHHARVHRLRERPDRASGPNLAEFEQTVETPLDSRWRVTMPLSVHQPEERVKTESACQDLHIVMIDHDADIVDIGKVLHHALRTLTGDFRGGVFVYVQCGRRIPSAAVPGPPMTTARLADAIYQLSRLKFAHDEELVQSEMRLAVRTVTGEQSEMPSSGLLHELISFPGSTSSSEAEVIHDILARRNLLFDKISDAHTLPLGALEDARFYIPDSDTGFNDDAPCVPLSSYHDLTEFVRNHKLITPAPPAPEPAHKSPPTVPNTSTAQSSSGPQHTTPTSPAPTPSPSTPQSPWVPGKVFAGVTVVRHHPVPEEKAFILDNPSLPDDECRLRTLDDLSEALNLIDPETFQRHVNAQKNDFAAWVEDAFDEKRLAEELRKFPTPLRMMVSIEKFIRYSDSASTSS